MRKLKNNIICIISLILLISGLMTISKQEDMPEDKNKSSGYSVIRGNMEKIDNQKNILKYKVNREYSFLDNVDYLEEEQYPQGLCITDEYIFITSYSDIRGNLGKIKIFDRQSGSFLLTLGMDTRSHLGGITYDGKNVWICNSSKMSVEKLSYSFIKQMISENPGKLIDARNLVEVYRVNNIPSTITFFDGQLWVATHSIWTNSTVNGYVFDETEKTLKAIGVFQIPQKVQGITFTEKGEVYLSTSYGRKQSSYIKKYESIHTMSKNVGDYIENIELPPCSEGIVYQNNNLYVLFESAGKKYLEGTDGKGKSPAPLDRILIISTS